MLSHYGINAKNIYEANRTKWHIELTPKGLSKGAGCSKCGAKQLRYFKGLCTPCFNTSKRKGRRSGSEHHNWKGGTAKHFYRVSAAYKAWRKAVFERDGFKCTICGLHSRQLQADHIKPQHYYPELRYDLDNGRTLCVPCHRDTDTFGSRVYKHQPAAQP